jgi:hypothetical protein
VKWLIPGNSESTEQEIPSRCCGEVYLVVGSNLFLETFGLSLLHVFKLPIGFHGVHHNTASHTDCTCATGIVLLAESSVKVSKVMYVYTTLVTLMPNSCRNAIKQEECRLNHFQSHHSSSTSLLFSCQVFFASSKSVSKSPLVSHIALKDPSFLISSQGSSNSTTSPFSSTSTLS